MLIEDSIERHRNILLTTLLGISLFLFSGCCKPYCDKQQCCGDDGCGGTCPDYCKEIYMRCDLHDCECMYSDEFFTGCEGRCYGLSEQGYPCPYFCFTSAEECDRETSECFWNGPHPTCMSIHKHCGVWDDGLGGMLDCGECPDNDSCMDGKCEKCKPWTCELIGAKCGKWHDSCVYDNDEGIINCGLCPEGESCSEFARCEEGDLGTIGTPCPHASGLHGGEKSCALGLTCVGEYDLGACINVADCGLPDDYQPECHNGACGYSFCTRKCDNLSCPAGFVENTSLGKCYCFPAP